MTEKGKGTVLGKFHAMQLTEADLQSIMRMHVNIRNKRKTEKNERVSKRNYGSRPECSIDDAVLEKILIFDNSLVTGNHIFMQ